MPGMSIKSPTVACVVSVTWAFERLGLLAVRLLADFVVTEAMVVGRTSRGARHGQPLGSLCSSYRRRAGGQRSRGSHGAVAGRSQATLGRVAGPKSLRAGHSAERSGCQLASVLHAASFNSPRPCFCGR